MEKLLSIVNQAFGGDISDHEDNFMFNKLDGWDSMNHMIFISSLEKEFSIELTAEDIVAMVSLAQTKEILSKYKND